MQCVYNFFLFNSFYWKDKTHKFFLFLTIAIIDVGLSVLTLKIQL